MDLITSFRSALVQADYNQKMADFLAKELAIISFIGAFGLWWLWTWQWFFWGLILIPIILSICMFVAPLRILLVGTIASLWALPFFIVGLLGLDAAYVISIVAYIMCFWVHRRALTWYKDLVRSDSNKGDINGNTIW